MAKVTRHSNYRVEVAPHVTGENTHEKMVEACDRIVLATRVGPQACGALAYFDSKDVCSFCGKPWVNAAGMCAPIEGTWPACCDAAEKERNANG